MGIRIGQRTTSLALVPADPPWNPGLSEPVCREHKQTQSLARKNINQASRQIDFIVQSTMTIKRV